MENSYDLISNIDPTIFLDKSILIVGAGGMANQYANCLSKLGFHDVTMIGQNNKRVNSLCQKFNFTPLSGGYQKNLSNLDTKDLVIIASPVETLLPAAELALDCGQNNILIEKPGSLFISPLRALNKKITNQNVRIAFNRLLYPNFLKLKQLIMEENGITSCSFTFTERIDRINFDKISEVYQRWGISNSLHVISMAFNLIGFPKEIHPFQGGKLDWHPSGSIFVGCGITENNIPFSYHADWQSAGRWGIEIMTNKNAYRLVPLEELFVCHKGTFNWETVSFKKAFPDIKQGVAEEIVNMLDPTKYAIELVSLEQAAQLIEIAEKIFGYDS